MKPTLTDNDIERIARLANLPKENLASIREKLVATLEYIEILKNIETQSVPATSRVGKGAAILRNDEINWERIIPAKNYQAKIRWE